MKFRIFCGVVISTICLSLSGTAIEPMPGGNYKQEPGELMPSPGGNYQPPQDGKHMPPPGGNYQPPQAGNNMPQQGGNYQQAGNNRPQQGENYQPPQAGNNRTQQGGNYQPPQAGNNRPQQGGNHQPPQAGNNRPQQGENNQPPQNGKYVPQDKGDYKSQERKDFAPQQGGNYQPPQNGKYEPQDKGDYKSQERKDFAPQQGGNYQPSQNGKYEPQDKGDYQTQQNEKYMNKGEEGKFKPEGNPREPEGQFNPKERSFDPNHKQGMQKFEGSVSGNVDGREGGMNENYGMENEVFNPFDPSSKREDRMSVFKKVYEQYKDDNNMSGVARENMGERYEQKSAATLEENVTGLEQKPTQEVPKFQRDTSEITNIIEKSYKFLEEREKQYAKMHNIVKVIEGVQDKNMQKELVREFQNILEEQSQIDKQAHGRIEYFLRFVHEKYNSFPDELKTIVEEKLKPMVEKYTEHLKVIKFFYDKLDSLKTKATDDILDAFLSKAEKYMQSGNTEDAVKYAENMMSMGIKSPEMIKKAGRILRRAEGDGPKVFVKGKKPEFDVKPTIVNGRTMVPIRAIANSLGITNENIKFDPQTRTITMTKDDKVIQLIIGEKKVIINGVEKEIDVAPMIINNRTLVPARAVAEAFDAKVNYDSETQVITVEDNFGLDDTSPVSGEIEGLSQELDMGTNTDEKTAEELIAQY